MDSTGSKGSILDIIMSIAVSVWHTKTPYVRRLIGSVTKKFGGRDGYIM